MRGKIICTLAGVVLGALGIMLLRPAGGVRPPAPERITDAELALDRPVGEVDFEDTPLDQALATLAQKSGTPIVVDWAGLSGVGLTPGQRVTLRARAIPLADALDRLLQPFTTSPDRPITYSAETGNVVIGTPERVAAHPIARIYDVRDLLRPEKVPDWKPPVTSAGYVSGGGFGGGPIGNGPRAATPAAVPVTRGLFGRGPPAPPYQRRLDSLRFLLENTVAPPSQTSSIDEFAGRLVVVHTWPVQRRVRAILHLLRSPIMPGPPAAAPAAKVWWPDLHQWLSDDTAPAEAGLLRVIPELRCERATFDEAVSILSKHAGVPIRVRRDLLRKTWRADVPVELRLTDVPVYRALELLLQTQDAGYAGGDGPGYGVEGGTIVVSTRDDVSRMTLTRAYDLRRWLWRERFDIGRDVPDNEAQATLARLITDTIAPASWRDNGSEYGSLYFFDNLMIVWQTWPNHERLRQFMLDLQNATTHPSTQPATIHAQ
jgi:hypothetical protein